MDIATDVLIYAWVGWAVLMLPTVCVLSATSWVLGKVSNHLCQRLLAIYRAECVSYYFQKMEKEGTHAFRRKADDKGVDI